MALAELGFDDAVIASVRQEGDAEAFAELCRRARPQLVRWFSRRTRDACLAEDLAQDTLLKAYLYGHQHDPNRPVWPWLYGIAAHRLVDHRRRTRPTVPLVDLTNDPAGSELFDEPGPLDEPMAALPRRQRMALTLRYLHGWSADEVAAFMGLTRNGLDQLLHRSRQKLKHEYNRVREQGGALLGPVLAPVGALWRRGAAAIRHAQYSIGQTWLDASAALSANVANALNMAASALTVTVSLAVVLGAGAVGLSEGPAGAGPQPQLVASAAVPDASGPLRRASESGVTPSSASTDPGVSPGQGSAAPVPQPAPSALAAPDVGVAPPASPSPLSTRRADAGTYYEVVPPSEPPPAPPPATAAAPLTATPLSAPSTPTPSTVPADPGTLAGLYCPDDPSQRGLVLSTVCPVLGPKP